MDEIKRLDKRNSLKVVTDNSLVDAKDFSDLSLNARKLFYIAVSQCHKSDKEFYEYQTTPAELAEMWGTDRSNVYREADKITTELMKIVITLRTGKKSFQKRHLFEKCSYNDDAVLIFKLHNEMTDLLLGLKKDFSQPLVWDFMKMRSPYSMALWHFFQKEMHSFKPIMTAPIEFESTVEELRQVTGCQDKLRQIGQFKERVLDKALREIRDNCLVSVKYTNIKKGRKVVGFRFIAESLFGTIRPEDMTLRQRQQVRKGQLIRKKADGELTDDEKAELDYLHEGLYQRTIEDYTEGYDL